MKVDGKGHAKGPTAAKGKDRVHDSTFNLKNAPLVNGFDRILGEMQIFIFGSVQDELFSVFSIPEGAAFQSSWLRSGIIVCNGNPWVTAARCVPHVGLTCPAEPKSRYGWFPPWRQSNPQANRCA